MRFFWIFYMGDFDLGDFQGVVTLGVARASKCIFPYRGARFSKGVPPHVHARGCTWPRRCQRRWKMARKQSSGKRKRLTLGKTDPKTVQRGKFLKFFWNFFEFLKFLKFFWVFGLFLNFWIFWIFLNFFEFFEFFLNFWIFFFFLSLFEFINFLWFFEIFLNILHGWFWLGGFSGGGNPGRG